jgi:hypothetical protein
VKKEREDGVAFSAPEKPPDACTPAARREGRVAAQCCATTQETKAMSIDIYDRISGQITSEFESGGRPRLKPWNAAYAKKRITHRLRGTSRADVKGVTHVADSNGKAMAHPNARDMWRADPEFWSANRAEHRFADGYELVAFDLPAANGYPATIGWELFGGPDYMTQVSSGQAVSLSEARAACEAAMVQALATLRHPPKG